MKAYHDCGFDGYMRPDHGRHIWNEKCRPRLRPVRPRARHHVSVGVWDMLEKLEGAH